MTTELPNTSVPPTPVPDTETPVKRNRSAWIALQHRDFRLVAAGQFVSLIGSSMQIAAVNWHVWNLTQNKLALGLVGLARVGPIIVLALYGGVLSDTFDRRRLFAITQTAMLIFSGVLALATLTGFDHDHLWVIYLATALISGANAVSQPSINAMLPRLVPEEHLPNAISLNTVLWQIGFVAGPIIGGQLIALTGNPGLAYVVNTLSFLGAIAAILLIHTSGKVEKAQKADTKAIREGLSFVRRTPLIWSTMILDFFATFFSSAMALLPVYSDQILGVGASGYGLLYAAPAIGSSIAALIMGQVGTIKRPGPVILIAVAMYGVATVLFGLSQTFAIALIALAAVGASDAVSTVLRNLVRQLLTPDRLRGRALSINMIFYMGGPQLGEFEAGALAQIAGPVFSVVSGGIATVVVVGVLALIVPSLRRFEWGKDSTPVR
ncbi:MAG: MFS transporter [Aggregatilineales bacterium]